MGEDIVEASETTEADEQIEKQPEAKSKVDRTIEDELPDETEYKSEHPRDAKYQPIRSYKKGELKSEGRKSAKGKGLEDLIETLRKEAKTLRVDEAEYISRELAKKPIMYLKGEEESTKKSAKRESDYDTPNGVAVIICNQEKEEFALEIASEDHPNPEARHKLKLIGEHIKVGENPPEALSRGLKEEDPNSYSILIQALKENGYFYDRVKGYVDGLPAELSIYVVELNQSRWEHYKLTKVTEGTKAIRNLDEIANSKKSDWAFFGDYEIILGFIGKNRDKFKIQPQYRAGIENKFVPFTYADSYSQNHSTLINQLLNSKENQQYKPIISSFHNLN